MSIKPINTKIGELLDKFLDDPEYYESFKAIAKSLGISSHDPTTIKVAMFSTVEGELTFASKELESLFTEWQLFIQLSDHEPYSSLLKEYPERKPKVMDIAHKLLEGEDVLDEDVIDLFKGLTK